MKKYEKILNSMGFAINSTLMSNEYCRKGKVKGIPVNESEILRSSRQVYMDLKVMMMRLERELYGEKTYEEDKTEVSDRNTSTSNNTTSRKPTTSSGWVGDFSC